MANKGHHQLLDQLVEEIKQNLVQGELDKLKTEILQLVDKSHNNSAIFSERAKTKEITKFTRPRKVWGAE